MFKIFIILFLFSVNLFAFENDYIPALKNLRTGLIYTNFDSAVAESISGDTFEIGSFSDTDGWKLTNNENDLLNYLELQEPSLKTSKKFYNTNWEVWDKWEFDNSNKDLKLIFIWYFYEAQKPLDFYLIKYGVKK